MLNVRIDNAVLRYRAAINQVLALNLPLDLDEIVAVVKGDKTVKRRSMKVVDFIIDEFEDNQNLAFGTRKSYR